MRLRTRMRRWLFATMLAASAGVSAQMPTQCGDLANAFGPYDFRKERGNNLVLVESAHFTAGVEALIAGTTGPIGGDIDYTLRAFPNHHRALLAMQRLGERLKTTQPRNARYDIECYYVRAVRFAPDDTVVRMLYARYLGQHNRAADGRAQLQAAEANAKDNAFTYYNLGLTYLELGDADNAAANARKAQELGFPRTDLRDRLAAMNKWTEPRDAAASAASTASAASAAPAASAAAAAPAAGR